MKNYNLNVSADLDEEFESVNVEVFIDCDDMDSNKIEQIVSRLDNFYDANGLNDIMNDSYNSGIKMVWKIEMFFNQDDVVNNYSDSIKLKEDVETYLKNLIDTEI